MLPELSNMEITRYSRHLLLPEVGMDGQRKLKQSKVLLIGAGGLGSPVALYLAAAGIGCLGLVDCDRVDITNLQRQIAYGTSDVGKNKLLALQTRLTDLNPELTIQLHETRLNSQNALTILKKYDCIIDGTDNFPTRYLINDACVLLQKPDIYGSVFQFEGQVSVFATPGNACYRCLFQEPPAPGLVPSCGEGGILGVVPGVIGTLQATEAIKMILGSGESLINRLLLFDSLKMKFRNLPIRRNKQCPLCGDNPSITRLIDYEQFCGLRNSSINGYENEISADVLQRKLQDQPGIAIIDVRERGEHVIMALSGLFPQARTIPYSELDQYIDDIKTADEVVFVCKMGIRSAQAVNKLILAGFKGKTYHLKGGLLNWVVQNHLNQPNY